MCSLQKLLLVRQVEKEERVEVQFPQRTPICLVQIVALINTPVISDLQPGAIARMGWQKTCVVINGKNTWVMI
jgi:hypothetical protein